MLRTLISAGILALTVEVCATNGASAAMQLPAAPLAGGNQLTPITFWAQPYPYKYVPWRRCPLVRVETPYGWYMDRVCAPVGPVLRRAY